MFAAKREDDTGSWVCKTITVKTKMSHEEAVKMAQAYAESNGIPVVYEQHDDERYSE